MPAQSIADKIAEIRKYLTHYKPSDGLEVKIAAEHIDLESDRFANYETEVANILSGVSGEFSEESYTALLRHINEFTSGGEKGIDALLAALPLTSGAICLLRTGFEAISQYSRQWTRFWSSDAEIAFKGIVKEITGIAPFLDSRPNTIGAILQKYRIVVKELRELTGDKNFEGIDLKDAVKLEREIAEKLSRFDMNAIKLIAGNTEIVHEAETGSDVSGDGPEYNPVEKAWENLINFNPAEANTAAIQLQKHIIEIIVNYLSLATLEADVSRDAGFMEIGRASCRERV